MGKLVGTGKATLVIIDEIHSITDSRWKKMSDTFHSGGVVGAKGPFIFSSSATEERMVRTTKPLSEVERCTISPVITWKDLALYGQIPFLPWPITELKPRPAHQARNGREALEAFNYDQKVSREGVEYRSKKITAKLKRKAVNQRREKQDVWGSWA